MRKWSGSCDRRHGSGWLNGNTLDCKPKVLGSNPGRDQKEYCHCQMCNAVFQRSTSVGSTWQNTWKRFGERNVKNRIQLSTTKNDGGYDEDGSTK